MAYVKQIAIGNNSYDIKAKAFDGVLPIANGGTNASTTAAAKENLNLCAAGQDVRFGSYSSAKQIWGVRANCVNTNNTDFNGKNVSLVVENDRLLLYNQTDSESIWNIKPGDYVQKSGDTMTGILHITTNGNTLSLGSQNSDFTHIYNSANIPFIFNKDIYTLKSHVIGQKTGQYRPFQLYLGYNTTAESRALNSNNPLIEFANADRTQYCQLVYTDYNSQGGSDSLTLVSNQSDCRFYAPKVFGAVWNDYAEFRSYNDGDVPYGKIVCENGDDTVSVSRKRLQKAAMVCSNTFGFAIGEEEGGIPIAVAGRALVYPLESREEFTKHIGDPVCSGPEGKMSLMTEEEAQKYPECIVGYVSAVPQYEEWSTGKIKVDGRVWIKIK